jgi:hypothetical protein
LSSANLVVLCEFGIAMRRTIQETSESKLDLSLSIQLDYPAL